MLGNQDSGAGDDDRPGIHFSLDCCHHLQWMYSTAERFGKGSTHSTLHGTLKAVEKTHVSSQLGVTPMLTGFSGGKVGCSGLGTGACAVLTSAWRPQPGRTARVAELVDALASGASARKGVGVQVPPRARRSEFSFLRNTLVVAVVTDTRTEVR